MIRARPKSVSDILWLIQERIGYPEMEEAREILEPLEDDQAYDKKRAELEFKSDYLSYEASLEENDFLFMDLSEDLDEIYLYLQRATRIDRGWVLRKLSDVIMRIERR